MFRLLKCQLFAMVDQGRLSLQIPEVVADTSEEDEWLVIDGGDVERLSGPGGVPSSKGYLFFSKEGWNRYRDQLKAAFRETGRGSWNNFVEAAEEHFKDRDLAIEGEDTRLRKRLR